MVEWKKLDPAVLETMYILGGFSPTANAQYKEVKGYTVDSDGEGCKIYLDADELKHMSKHLMIAARWLEQRADEYALDNPSKDAYYGGDTEDVRTYYDTPKL